MIPRWSKKGHVFIECPLAKKQTNVEKAKSAAKARRQNINKRLCFYRMIIDGVSVCIDAPY